MLTYIYQALQTFRKVFSRHSPWLTFCLVVLGFLGATQMDGVSSWCRFWHLQTPGYLALLHFFQIPSDLVVKSQVTDIIDLVLQLIRHPNSVHRSCHHRKSRGTVLSTAAVRWATTKFDGVWKIPSHKASVFLENAEADSEECESIPHRENRRSRHGRH
jgi:hypothetical protein